MSYLPVSYGFNQSLLGVGSTPNTFNLTLKDSDSYTRLHGGSNKNTIVVIVVSALLFITIISIFDILRNVLHNKYAKIALNQSKISKKDKNNTLIANYQGLIASVNFSVICIIVTVITLYIISIFIKY